MVLKRRDIAALVVGTLTFFGILISTGIIDVTAINPFVDKINVKASVFIDCFAGWCWMTDKVKLEYEVVRLALIPPKKLAYWCGPLGGPKPVEVTFTLVDPEMNVYEKKVSDQTCTEGWMEFYHSFAARIPGTYKIKAKVCGEAFWGWHCVIKEAMVVV